jgi:hypothetical protein
MQCVRSKATQKCISPMVGALFSSISPCRDARYGILGEQDVTFFKSVLGDRGVITDPSDLEPYNSYV